MQKFFSKTLPVILLAQIFCCLFLLLPDQASAKTVSLGGECNPNADECAKGSCMKTNTGYECALYVPSIGIPNSPFSKGVAFNGFDGTTKPIAAYIQSIYNYAIGAVAILATIVMMIGGLVWITAGGNQTRVSTAKDYISGAVIGLVLTMCSYMILKTVNPDLVTFKPIEVKTIKSNDANWYNSPCGDSSHMGYGTESFAYNGCSITASVCTCVSGAGESLCDTKGIEQNCKAKGTIIGKVNIDESTWTCEDKALCHQCCSQECEKGFCLAASVCNLQCK